MVLYELEAPKREKNTVSNHVEVLKETKDAILIKIGTLPGPWKLSEPRAFEEGDLGMGERLVYLKNRGPHCRCQLQSLVIRSSSWTCLED